jgi:hypothetical protein
MFLIAGFLSNFDFCLLDGKENYLGLFWSEFIFFG